MTAIQNPSPISESDRDRDDESLVAALGREMNGMPWYMTSTAIHMVLFLFLLLIPKQIVESPRQPNIHIEIEEPVIDDPVEMDEKKQEDPDLTPPIVKPDEIEVQDTLTQVPVDMPDAPELDNVDVALKDTEFDFKKGDLESSDLSEVAEQAWISLNSPNANTRKNSSNPYGRPNGNDVGGKRTRVSKIWKNRPIGPGSNPVTQVDDALEWLSEHQESDGHWDTAKYNGGKHDVAVTSMAVLAFLAGGHSPEQGRYRFHVRRGVEWLMTQQAENGRVGPHRYEAALGAMAIAETYGMSMRRWRVKLRKPAQKAIDYAVASQCNAGGWDYVPHNLRNDTSVSGWWIMALKSGKVSGLNVPAESIANAVAYVRAATDAKGSVSYAGEYATTDAVKAGGGTMRMTAVSLTCQRFLGCKKNEKKVQGCFRRLAPVGLNPEAFDFYAWYYQGLGLFQMGYSTPEFQRFLAGLNRAVMATQIKDGSHKDLKGSWNSESDAYGPKWGRVGQTALGSLMLSLWRFEESS